MLVSGQNALRAYRKSWPIVPGLQDPVRPIRQVEALGHWEKDLALYLDAHPGFLDCGVDTWTDGNMEAAGTAAYVPWDANSVLSKSAVAPHSGLQCLQVQHLAAGTGGFRQIIVGQTACVLSGWVLYNGAGTIQVLNGGGGGCGLWNGAPSPLWQQFFVPMPMVGTSFYCLIQGGGAGDFSFWDDILFTPLNVITWSDRTRRGGRNPTQAVAAARPVRTDNDQPSGRTSVVFDGVDDKLKTPAFTLVQPEESTLTMRWTAIAGAPYVFDGNGTNSMALYNPAGINASIYSGADLVLLNSVNNVWQTHQMRFDGAASRHGMNFLTPAVGNVGAANGGAVTFGGPGAAAGFAATARIGNEMTLTRVLSDSERTNLVQAAMRRACI